jgi:hypothetical protein
MKQKPEPAELFFLSAEKIPTDARHRAVNATLNCNWPTYSRFPRKTQEKPGTW